LVASMAYMFFESTNFNNGGVALDWANTSSVTNMSNMFTGATSFNQDVSAWNTSAVINMSYMFKNTNAFNQDISPWNTSAVTNMFRMFYANSAFNNGGVALDWANGFGSNCSMSEMFMNADAFNQPIGTWNIVNVTNMQKMFNNADVFNQDVSPWNTSSVTNMAQMFYDNSTFNNGGVALDWTSGFGASCNMAEMFSTCTAFNQDLSAWNTSTVTSMRAMFQNADDFNQDISGWNVGAVTNMREMFQYTNIFNNGGVALNWANTAAVTNMSAMFKGATTFNQNISGWNVSSVTSSANFRLSSALTCANTPALPAASTGC